ncbi:hypothetical protein [Vibrio azureus]|nr:hypothetical protein [Vibrio azureus]
MKAAILIPLLLGAVANATEPTIKEHFNQLNNIYGLMEDSKSRLTIQEVNGLISCDADSNWIDSPSLPVDPLASSEFDIICKFHKFAWQSFAYYTSFGESAPKFLELMPKERIFKRIPDEWDWNGDKNLVLDNMLQAGSQQPLIDWQDNPVFYQQSVNQIFYDDIVSNELNNSQCVAKVDSGEFPFDISAGSTEVKTSWKILSPTDDEDKFFTINRSINKSGVIEDAVKLGLVGMHIVRKTPAHPEWIWTTFEHKDNAPNCDEVEDNVTVNPTDKWLFFNESSWQGKNVYIPNNPTQVCRKTPYGAGFLAKAGLRVIEDIEDLNQDMQSYYQQRGSIWENYFLVGSAWTQSINPFSTNGELPPTWKNEIGGSSLLSNTTMETYRQNPKWFDLEHPTKDRGCFGCHNYNSTKESPIHLSHMFNAAKDYGDCKGLVAKTSQSARF